MLGQCPCQTRSWQLQQGSAQRTTALVPGFSLHPSSLHGRRLRAHLPPTWIPFPSLFKLKTTDQGALMCCRRCAIMHASLPLTSSQVQMGTCTTVPSRCASLHAHPSHTVPRMQGSTKRCRSLPLALRRFATSSAVSRFRVYTMQQGTAPAGPFISSMMSAIWLTADELPCSW